MGASLSADLLTWIWAPITVFAAFTQTLRNAAQRHLTKDLGTLGATLVRFLYGLPFAALWLAIVSLGGGLPLPAPGAAFGVWVTAGAMGQIAATALLLRAMAERNFAIGVAYSKTEIIQVAVFSIVLLGDPLSLPAAVAIILGTAGVTLLSPQVDKMNLASFAAGWTSPAALFGIASGTCFAISAVGYRGAALSLDAENAFIAAAYTLVWAQFIQTVTLGGWLLARSPATIRAVLRAWRVSILAGLFGALASMGWFTAMALEPAAHVRTLGLVEVLFSYLVSLRIFRERLSPVEIAGLVLLVLGVAAITVRA
jgi:drug/metabolite transporter (DMT)-like permease